MGLGDSVTTMDQAQEPELYDPTGVAVDSNGIVYTYDSHNKRVRMVNATTGIITTVAENGKFGYSGDNGPATQTEVVA